MAEAQGSPDDSALAHETAGAIVAAFARYNAEYRAITRRAPERFESRDWNGVQADVVERLDLYSSIVNQTTSELRQRLGARAMDTALWTAIKGTYSEQIAGLTDPEFLKTFFSSIKFVLLAINPFLLFSRMPNASCRH